MQTQVLGVLPHGCPVQAVIRVLHVGQYLHPQEEGIPQQASADPAGGRKDGIRVFLKNLYFLSICEGCICAIGCESSDLSSNHEGLG